MRMSVLWDTYESQVITRQETSLPITDVVLAIESAERSTSLRLFEDEPQVGRGGGYGILGGG